MWSTLCSLQCPVLVHVCFALPMSKAPFVERVTHHLDRLMQTPREVPNSIKDLAQAMCYQAFCTPEPQYLMTQESSFVRHNSLPFKREVGTADILHHIHTKAI